MYNVVIMGGRARLRAVLLTSITTILGLLPLLVETSLQARFLIPMGVAISFGLAFTTVLTLLGVPCLYLIVEDIRRLIPAWLVQFLKATAISLLVLLLLYLLFGGSSANAGEEKKSEIQSTKSEINPKSDNAGEVNPEYNLPPPPRQSDPGWQYVLPLMVGLALVVYLTVKGRSKPADPDSEAAIRRDAEICEGLTQALREIRQHLHRSRAAWRGQADIDARLEAVLQSAAQLAERVRNERIHLPEEEHSGVKVAADRLSRLHNLLREHGDDAKAAASALAATNDPSETSGKCERLQYHLQSITESLDERGKVLASRA